MTQVSPYGDPFAPSALTADFDLITGALRTFFDQVRADQWDNPTGPGAADWTLRQTLAHITVVAEIFDAAIQATANGDVFHYPEKVDRSTIGTFNQREIAARQAIPPAVLVQNLLDALARTAHRIEGLAPAQLQTLVDIFVYCRPMTLAHLIGAQLSHPGLIHAAQFTRSIALPPLWLAYPLDLLHRQLARALTQIAYFYWPTKGGDLRATVQFRVGGAGGGHWYIEVGPEGGTLAAGSTVHPTLTMWTRSADALCNLITFNVEPVQAVLRGQIFAYGNPWKARRFLDALTIAL